MFLLTYTHLTLWRGHGWGSRAIQSGITETNYSQAMEILMEKQVSKSIFWHSAPDTECFVAKECLGCLVITLYLFHNQNSLEKHEWTYFPWIIHRTLVNRKLWRFSLSFGRWFSQDCKTPFPTSVCQRWPPVSVVFSWNIFSSSWFCLLLCSLVSLFINKPSSGY